jgi:hypothetical protein
MTAAIEPAIVLAAYAEPVASGRRVLLHRPCHLALPPRLVERGARVVHVCEIRTRYGSPRPRPRTARKTFSFSALADGHFALREGAFDVCIVEDAGISDPVALIKKIRRALTRARRALLASLNPETRVPLLPHRPSGVISLDYYALYDAVKAEFEHVRMLGQAPFVGYVIADLRPRGTPEPSLDTAFLPSGAEEPELFIAGRSQQPVELEAFAVVQLPYRSVVRCGSSDSEALTRSRGEGSLAASSPSEPAGRRKARARGKLTEAGRSREQSSRRRGKLTKRAALAAVSWPAPRHQAARGRDRVFARDAELLGAAPELENKNQQLKQQKQAGRADEQAEARAVAEEAAAAAAELAALEQDLAERGEHVRKLERDLREAERVGKELVRQLPGGNPDERRRDAPQSRRSRAGAKAGQEPGRPDRDPLGARGRREARRRLRHPEA